MAEALAIEVMKGFAVDSAKLLLKMVVARIAVEIRLAWGFKDSLRNLEKEVRRVEGMLIAADLSLNSMTNPLVVDWLNSVRAVGREAEDVLDEYAYEIQKRMLALNIANNNNHNNSNVNCQRQIRFKSKVRFVFSWSSNPVFFRFRMAHKVKDLKESIDAVKATANSLGISLVGVTDGQTYNDVATTIRNDAVLQLHRQHVNSDGLIGRAQDEANLMKLLCETTDGANHDYRVIGICGMTGLGKTALCKSLLEKTVGMADISERIMITVSYEVKWNQMLNSMVQQLHKENLLLTDDKLISEKLQEKLKGKKFLLVLDDVWDTFTKWWSPLKVFLKSIGGAKGTTILVTSRSQHVLEKLKMSGRMGRLVSPFFYQLNELEERYAWDLFEQILGDDLSDSAKLEIAARLFKKCDRVPLAVITLGKLLNRQNDVQNWTEIEKSEIWDQEDEIIMPSLKLSFKYLPSIWLKKCFAYCAIFREDEEIDKDRLIQLWMAQGYLQPNNKMEEVGEYNFHYLLGNSLFQDAMFDELGKVESCKMHDVVRALARAVSGQEVCTWVMEEENSSERTTSADEMQHLCLDSNRDLSLEVVKKLRTLDVGYFGWDMFTRVMASTTCLRSLSLVRVGLEVVPDSIGEMKLLRYLDLSLNSLQSIPGGLAKLYNLQTLRAFGNYVEGLGYFFPQLTGELRKLINLRHLCSDLDIGIPGKLGAISGLQTIPCLDLWKDWGGRLSELGSLTELKGTLSLTGLEKAQVQEVRELNLASKAKIEELHLQWKIEESGNIQEEKLEALQPHRNLKSLSVCKYSCARVPDWFREMKGYGGAPLNRLVRLDISNCGIHQLPSLKGLAALEHLKIDDCRELVDMGEMPPLAHLWSLEITRCNKMTSLPAGIAGLRSLKLLELGEFRGGRRDSVFPFPIVKDVFTDSIFFHPLSNSLTFLSLHGYGMERVYDLPDQIQHLLALHELRVWDFSSLRDLPEWLGNLSCLRILKLAFMLRVCGLPSQAALRHLTYLEIVECPGLNDSCYKDVGHQWSKIQHIPVILIDNNNIQNTRK